MTDPVEVRNERVETSAGAPPPSAPGGPPPGPGYAPGSSYTSEHRVTTRSTSLESGFRGRQTVWVCIAIVDLFLALDFIFFAAGANDTGFASLVYTIGGALAAPFRGIFNITTAPHGHPLQWADLLAILIYTLAAWIVNRLILIATTPSDRRGATIAS